MSEEQESLYELDMAQLSINSARERLKATGNSQALDTVAVAQSHIDQARQAIQGGGDINVAMEHVEQAIEALSSLLS